MDAMSINILADFPMDITSTKYPNGKWDLGILKYNKWMKFK